MHIALVSLSLAFSSAVFGQETVTVSGTFNAPPEIIEERGIDIVLIDLDGSTGFENFWANVNSESGTFTAEVPPAKYGISVTAGGMWLDDGRYAGGIGAYFSAASVDASAGDVMNVTVPETLPHKQIYTRVPPVASLISVGPANESGIAVVRGSPGAADGPATVAIVNLQTGQRTFGASDTDGSFDIPMFAPEGSYLAVHHDISGNMVFHNDPSLSAGTIIRVPVPGEENGAFATGAKLGFNGEFSTGDFAAQGGTDVGQIWLWGSIDNRNWSAGQSGTMAGTAKIYSRNIANQTPSMNDSRVYLERIFDGNGRQELPNPEQASHFLTPTGFPVERRNGNDPIEIGFIELGAFNQTSDRSGETTWNLNYQLPANLPDGIYQLVLAAGGDDNNEMLVTGLESQTRYNEDVFPHIFDKLFATGAATLINVNSPATPRLSLALGMNYLSNGSRGTVALEDRDRLAIAPHIKTHSRDFVVPAVNPESGEPYSYRLEPFAPLMGSGNRGWISPPTVPIDFSSGQFNVQLKYPDGSVQNLVNTPIRQPYIQRVVDSVGNGTAGNSPGQYFGLTTLDSNLEVTFSQYGLHTVSMTGHVFDIFGKRYDVSGTFEIHVANLLDLEFGVFPNTPFEVGDHFAPGVIVQPGVAAEIEARLTHFPNSDPAQKVEKVFQGQANRFGYFQPDSNQQMTFSSPGEYRVDYTARFVDSNGVMWMGSRSWGSVVATPNSSIVTRGRRGGDGSPSGEAPLWFNLKDNELVQGGMHLHFPFAIGDIVWMEDDIKEQEHAPGQTTAMLLMASLQDPTGRLGDWYRQRVPNYPIYPKVSNTWDIENRIALGEIPLFSSSDSGLSPTLIPDVGGNHWAYFYGGAARPGVAVREAVTEDDSGNTYWRFDDQYNMQLGNGVDGDRPNDFKFLFAGAVYRAPDENFNYYGAYGGMWVMLPYSDSKGGRTMPPFQGNGGGPSGGPIMTLKGRQIDMFLHPMGVRPGSILELGDVAAFSGQVAPTLESQVWMRVVSPSGAERTIQGNSNLVGFFHDPSSNFIVDEPGVWTVYARTSFRGQTSAGQVSEPYPEGDILGTDNGRFHFYVVEPDSAPLEVDIPARSLVQPGKGLVQIPLLPTDELSKVVVHRTTVMPGFVLEDAQSSGTTYTYDAQALHEDFPNLDVVDGSLSYGVDTVTMSFLVSGEDGAGNIVYQARQVLLQGEELLAPDQPAAEVEPFAINAGHSGAWYNPDTSGQGQLIDIEPESRFMFLAWFAYTDAASENPNQQHWLTAQGTYDGNTAVLPVYETLGGQFDDPAEVDPPKLVGSIELEFDNCTAGQANYNIDSWDVTGSFPLSRVIPGSENVCLVSSGVPEETITQNDAWDGAWYNADTSGQGFLIDSKSNAEGDDFIFVAWFTYGDTNASGQRWLTAQGPLVGDQAEITVYDVTGGSFDDPAPVNPPVAIGSMRVEFTGCDTAQLSYDLTDEGLKGSMDIIRVIPGTEALCESLSGSNE